MSQYSNADNQALSVSDLENDPFHVTTSSNGGLSPISSSESHSLVISPESASPLANNNSDASAASLSTNSGDNDKRGSSPSQAVTQSYSNITSSYHYEGVLSSYQMLDYQGSAGDVSSSTSPTAVTDEGISSHARSTMTIRSGNPDHFVESLDEKVIESTDSIGTEADASMSRSPTSLQECQASTAEVGSEKAETTSSQESFPSSHSTHHSTSTEEPGVITPELHPSRLDVTVEEHDGPCSTPPLSPDNDVCMVADTTIGTIQSDQDLFFNGDLAMNSAGDLSLTKTDSEEEKDSDDEDVPGIPLLLFDQTARLASVQGSVSSAISRKEIKELIYRRRSTNIERDYPSKSMANLATSSARLKSNSRKRLNDLANLINLVRGVRLRLPRYKAQSRWRLAINPLNIENALSSPTK